SLAQGLKLAACIRPAVLPTAAAEWLASESRFWYARIEALHAVAYEAIARNSGVPVALGHSRTSDPHPLVRRIAHLALRAVETGAPEQWLWEDEMPVARGLSTTLRPEAIQAVADIALLLNLSQNSDQETRDRNARKDSLPRCLASGEDRSRLTDGPRCAP